LELARAIKNVAAFKNHTYGPHSLTMHTLVHDIFPHVQTFTHHHMRILLVLHNAKYFQSNGDVCTIYVCTLLLAILFATKISGNTRSKAVNTQDCDRM
jgi:hypothetical protein